MARKNKKGDEGQEKLSITCERCDEPLVRRPWNSTTDVISCDNYDCPLYHTPVKQNEATISSRIKRTKTPERSEKSEPNELVARARRLLATIMHEEREE